MAAAAILGIFLVRESSLGAEAAVRWLLVGGLILLVGARPAFLAASTAFVLVLAVLVLQPAAIFAGRSFFGVTQVLRPAGAPFTLLMNGTTLHGVQPTDPRQSAEPEAYYARPGPFGDLFRVLASEERPHVVAVVGLGAGATAAYVRQGWSMTYFEIDPLVEAVASNPALFSYLSGAAQRPSVVLGDARLSLQAIADESFDAIVVDAFSSDSVPTHLLTTEAMAEYARVIRPGGLILIYDLRRDNPRNKGVHRIADDDVRRWFPSCPMKVHHLTLAPPLARPIGRHAPFLYGPLALVPLLRTHTLWVLRRPALPLRRD